MTIGTEITRLPRPIFVIGCNRSGTTLLFNNLSAHPLTWSLYIEGQDVFSRHFPLQADRGEQVAAEADRTVATAIRDELYSRAHNKEYFQDRPLLRHIPRKMLQRPLGALYKGRQIRLVEKTPANCLRIPLLHQIFPDARYLFLVRRGQDVVSSLMEGWKNWSRTGDDWHYTKWHYLAPAGWQDYRDRPLQEICAFQWIQSTVEAWDALNRLAGENFLLLRHEELMSNPREEYRKVLAFCDLPASAHLDRLLGKIQARVFTTGGSKPRPDKWRALHEKEILSVSDRIDAVNQLFYR
jgi:hypothetical protein